MRVGESARTTAVACRSPRPSSDSPLRRSGLRALYALTVPDKPVHESKFTEIGASGLQIVGGRVNEEFLPVLRGDKGVRMWREMGDNDPYSGALLYGLLQTVLRATWSIDLNDAPEAEGEFLEQCQDDMEHPFRDVVAEAMTMGQYGWALLETVMKTRNGPDAPIPSDFDDGRIGWRKMPLRAQETLFKWVVDYAEGEIIAMTQRLWGSELDSLKDSTVDIPLGKCLLFRTTHHKNNPEGRSMLRSGWVPYNKRKQIEIFEGIGVERDLAGLPVFQIPADMLHPQASDADKAAVEMFKTIGKNLRVDDQAFVLLPQEYDDKGNKMYEFSLASTQGKGKMFDTNVIINRLAVAQLMSIMADVMMVGHEGVGSMALSKTKEQMFTSGVQSLLDEVRDILNNYAVPRLFRINGIKGPFPQFSTSPIQRVDPNDFVTMVLTLAQSGMSLWPDDDLDQYVREFLGWPARSQENQDMAVLQQEASRAATENLIANGGVPPAPPADDAPPTAADSKTKKKPPASGPGKGAAAANPKSEEQTQSATATPSKKPPTD